MKKYSGARLLLAAALALGAPAVAAAPASAAPAVTVDYVNLGDSYASGVGAGAETGACRVTDGAYANLWSTGDVDLTFAACSGATTADVLAKQVGELEAGTDLVTLTIGANDLRLTSLFVVCSDPERAAECTAGLAAAQQALVTTLPVQIGQTLAAVKKAAPKAKIVVLGYPLPFENAAECPSLPLAKTFRDAGDAALAGVNAVAKAQAAAAGATYADVTAGFAGHGLCSTEPWIVGAQGFADGTILHPTLQGQKSGYLPALTAAAGTPAEVLAWIKERDASAAPVPSASVPVPPSASPGATTSPTATASPAATATTSPTATATAAPGGDDQGGEGGGGSLPVTGANLFWVIGAGVLLIVAGAVFFFVVRPRRIRTTVE